MIRKCRKCGKTLPPSRYFNCLACQPVLPKDDDDFIYHGTSATLDNVEVDIEDLWGDGNDEPLTKPE